MSLRILLDRSEETTTQRQPDDEVVEIAEWEREYAQI